jgi:hypothetical protein
MFPKKLHSTRAHYEKDKCNSTLSPVRGMTRWYIYDGVSRRRYVAVAARPIRRRCFPTRAEHGRATPPPHAETEQHALVVVLHAPVADRVRFWTVAALVRGCGTRSHTGTIHAHAVHAILYSHQVRTWSPPIQWSGRRTAVADTVATIDDNHWR